MADITIPVLESYSRLSGTGLKSGDQININYDVYDESPISRISFEFYGPTGNHYYLTDYSFSGSSLDKGQVETTTLDNWPDGFYTLNSISIYERGSSINGATYYRDGYISKHPNGALGESLHNFAFSSSDFIVGNISSAHKQISGTEAGDLLEGSFSHDQITAGSGNDILIGSGGNDILDGGDGSDTAIWSAFRLKSLISLVPGGDDTISPKSIYNIYGPIKELFKGTDTARGVENFVFTDGKFVTDIEDTAAQVYRLYGATLGRAPDSGGLKGWAGEIESGRLTLRQATDGFTSSAEFQNKYGNVDNAGFVDLLYENVLGRDPDLEGFQYWLDAIASGMNRSEVVLNFSESAENIQRTQASVEQGLWLRDDQAAIVARLYDSTFDRLPDASGLTYWTNDIKAGASLQQVASGFIGSTEFQTQYGALDDTAFVQQLYRNVLDREGEASGVETWKGALQSGMSRSDVVLGFSESAEHQNKLAPHIDDGIWLL